jgi:hypothetical protein
MSGDRGRARASLGIALLLFAAWLARYDLARRTVHDRGLSRYTAVCLLSGYAWLATAGLAMAANGLVPGTPSYDLALHALFVGFVFAMVFGHAPIIVPAVLRVALPYSAAFYLPLVLLHAGVALRVAGDLAQAPSTLAAGGIANAVAIVAFIATAAASVARGPACVPRLAVDRLVLGQELVARLDDVGMLDDAVRGTDELALRLVLGADAFGAARRVDRVDEVAGADRLVRADRPARVAQRAVVVDREGHGISVSGPVTKRQAAARPVSSRRRSWRYAPHSAAPIAPA